jgi:methyl-accepting chemotaxis protein
VDKVTDLTNVEVCAEIEIPSIAEAVLISRKMSKPNELIYDDQYEAELTPILELLNRGQYVFTRREVLKLITAKSSSRAQEIQKVLKLSELEEIRANLVRVYNEFKREHRTAKDAYNKNKRDVLAITGQDDYDEQDVLKFVNEQRKKLGGGEIDKLEAEKLQDSITGVQVNPISINHKNLSERITNLKQEEIDKICEGVSEANDELRTTIKEIKEDSQANWNAKRHGFTKDGIKLIRDTGECPLCDKEWPSGDLREYLQERIDEASARQSELSENTKKIIEQASAVKIRIQQVKEIVAPVAETEQAKESEIFSKGINHLNIWTTKLIALINALERPIEDYTQESFDDDDVKGLFVLSENDAMLEEFETEVKKLFPEATPEQTAWDNLTKLKERIKIVEETEVTLEKALMNFKIATELRQAYVSSRDAVLESLYDKIKGRFVGLYKEMHGDDEKAFDAAFTPQEAGLNLEVDFYGRGLHPPHALHSEGHQDSMGVCLFLALSEHLNTDLIDLVILDDVVMSVDIGHRRAFCSVLAHNFPDKQFIITTHDTFWANQLRGEGVVNRKQMLKFSDWSVETGPRVHYEADMWSRIEEDLKKDDISAASAKLRNGLEEYTRFVCHNLRAKVPYTLEDAGSLGDFLPAAIGTFNELLCKAKASANSWNRQDVLQDLNAKSDFVKDVISRALGEQWTINTTVHFNDWAKLSKEDFIPVVEAFRELCDSVFACNNEGCESVLKVTYDGGKINGVRCRCGANNWNLIKK